jgi:hypothetical protein
MTDVRKGQWPGTLPREAFAAEGAAIERLERIAREAYADGRKAPITREAGPDHADPDHELSVDWTRAKERIDRARTVRADPATPVAATRIRPRPAARTRRRRRRSSSPAGTTPSTSTAAPTAVHGDVAGTGTSRRALSDRLDWMGLVDAGFDGRHDRCIGYRKPYATSHPALGEDTAVQEEVPKVGRALVRSVEALRRGELQSQRPTLPKPRPKRARRLSALCRKALPDATDGRCPAGRLPTVA